MALIWRGRAFRTMAMGATMALAACGTASEAPVLTLAQGLTSNAFPAESEASVVSRDTLSRTVIEQLDQPLILVEYPSIRGAEIMTLVGRNDDVETWRGREGRGLALRRSALLVSTRGYGFDLLASDPTETEAALAAQSTGAVARVMVHLDGEHVAQRQTHLCSLHMDGVESIEVLERTYQVTRMTEECETGAGRYENIYWRDESGILRRSLQWVSPEVGHVRIERLS